MHPLPAAKPAALCGTPLQGRFPSFVNEDTGHLMQDSRARFNTRTVFGQHIAAFLDWLS